MIIRTRNLISLLLLAIIAPASFAIAQNQTGAAQQESPQTDPKQTVPPKVTAPVEAIGEPQADSESVFDEIEIKDISGEKVHFKKYQGKVVLVVNVASKCGFTGQFKPLQTLHKEYHESGLAVVAFPCNQFGKQEPLTEEQIKEFCHEKFGVEFDIFSKVDVKGSQQQELFARLTRVDLEPAGKGDIKWNFEKFLVGKDGKPIARFRSNVSPKDNRLVEKVRSALGLPKLEQKDAAKKPSNWSFKPNPKLPNVLILGDSISIGYTLRVREQLKGKANVYRPLSKDGTRPANCSGTTTGVQSIDAWLSVAKWDVIHFNWGLHDLKHVKEAGTNDKSNDPNDPTQATLEQYEKNLAALTEKIIATGALPIFATTTPVAPGTQNPLRVPEAPVRYNAAAVTIMKKQGIRVNDLHALCLPHLEKWQKPKNVHFRPAGSAALAERVSAVILEALSARPGRGENKSSDSKPSTKPATLDKAEATKQDKKP